jgi:hypothetical protein
MRERFSAFGSQVYRPLVIQILPGAVGILPWYVVPVDRNESLRMFASQHSGEALLAYFLAALLFGHVFEDLGSRCELFFDSRRTLALAPPQVHTVVWRRNNSNERR